MIKRIIFIDNERTFADPHIVSRGGIKEAGIPGFKMLIFPMSRARVLELDGLSAMLESTTFDHDFLADMQIMIYLEVYCGFSDVAFKTAVDYLEVGFDSVDGFVLTSTSADPSPASFPPISWWRPIMFRFEGDSDDLAMFQL
jgi:hypothetical protein